MSYLLLIAVAWGSRLLPLPRWLSFIFSLVVLLVGTIFVLFGVAGVFSDSPHLDSQMRPGSNTAVYGLVAGILIVWSRAVWLVKGLLSDPHDPTQR